MQNHYSYSISVLTPFQPIGVKMTSLPKVGLREHYAAPGPMSINTTLIEAINALTTTH